MHEAILDFYDDRSGMIFRQLLPDPRMVPGFIKQASTSVLAAPDEDFALLLVDSSGKKMRKFACVDPGNTALSVMYFMRTGGFLPEEQQKIAASNLVVACRRHNIAVPEPLAETAGDNVRLHSIEYMEYVPALIDFQAEALNKTASGMALDTIDEVSYALCTYDETYRDMPPAQRHAEAVSLEKRASALGIPVSSNVQDYAGETYSKHLGMFISARTSIDSENPFNAAYNSLYKKASQMTPEVFAEALLSLDEHSGYSNYWDSYLPDPYYSTFEKKAEEAEFEWTDGIDKVTETDLQRMARNHRVTLVKQFGSSLTEGFCNNPVAIFSSLPQPQKKIMARMAQDNNHPGEGNHE